LIRRRRRFSLKFSTVDKAARQHCAFSAGKCECGAEKAKCCTEFAIFCAENAKCRTRFVISLWKCETLRRIWDFPRRKSETPPGIQDLHTENSKSRAEFPIFLMESANAEGIL